MDISKWLNEEINENNFEDFLNDKFLHAIECGYIELDKGINRESYEELIKKELEFIKVNNLVKTFAITYNCVMKAHDCKAKPKMILPFNTLIGYIIDLTHIDPLNYDETKRLGVSLKSLFSGYSNTGIPKNLNIYYEINFGGLDNSSFVDYIVNKYGFAKPIETESVYLLSKDNVFIQLDIKQPKTEIKVINKDDLNTLKNNAEEFFNNTKIHSEETDYNVMVLINNEAFTIVKEELLSYSDIKKYLIDKYTLALHFVLCKESVKSVELQKELKIGFMLAEYLLLLLEEQDVISTLFFVTRERKVIMKLV